MRLALALTLCLVACDDDEPERGCQGSAFESNGRCLCPPGHTFVGHVCLRRDDAGANDATSPSGR